MKIKQEIVIRITCICLLFVWALIQVWANRFHIHYIDGICYLDMANYFMAGDWVKGFSTYWNPVYPALIALIFYILHPTLFYEFMALKAVNLTIFVFLITAFEYFLQVLLNFYKQEMRQEISFLAIPDSVWIISAHIIFAYSFLCLNGVGVDTPDMLMSVFLFLALAIALKIYRGQSTFLDCVLFGFIGGFAYIIKNAALLVILACLPCLWLKRHNIDNFWQKIIVILTTLLLTIAPYVACISQRLNTLTFSTAGKINYIWYVQEYNNNIHIPIGSVIRQWLVHPVRQIVENPAVFEFAKPISGTYPLWFDPAYWMQGSKTRIHPLRLMAILACNIWYYGLILFFPLAIVLLVCLLLNRKAIFSANSLVTNSLLLFPSLTGFLEYAAGTNLVIAHHMFVDRLFSAFSSLLVIGILASLRIRNDRIGKRIFKTSMVLAMVLLLGAIGLKFWHDYQSVLQSGNFEYYQIAEQLKKEGLVAGNRVARIGEEELLFDWAKLAGLKIVMDVPDSAEFWSVSPARRKEILNAMKKYDVKMAIYFSEPLTKLSSELWTINHTGNLGRAGMWWIKYVPKPQHNIIPKDLEGWHQLNNFPCWVYKIDQEIILRR